MKAAALLALLLLVAVPARAQAPLEAPPPEGRTVTTPEPPTFGHSDMVAAANPLAAAAGRDMLRRGGSAVDAAIATQLVLNLVEPQSSGLGGGAFLVYWSAAEHRVVTFDGRETAPAAARPDRFLGPDGKPLAFYAAVVGGRSVGVPGVLRMLALAHRRYGKLPWRALFAPAIALADQGFAPSPRLEALLAHDPYLRQHEPARDYFYGADGAPKRRLVNQELAETLRRVAAGGADAFYSGPIAADIVRTVDGAAGNPGDLTLADLAGYRAVARAPVCGLYRRHRLCGMGPPSSGAVTLLELLDLLQRFDMGKLAPRSVEAVHLFAEAGRLAYADRDRYLADPDFVPVPVKGLLDPGYLAARARLIDPERAAPGPVAPGNPPGSHAMNWGDGRAPELPGTSNIAVFDAAGDALAMTTTIENAFGSRLMVRGFLLNNELTDFSFVPEDQGRPVANRVEAGKRPRSAMAPTLVFDRGGKPMLAVGSAGGPAIINDVAKTIIAVIDWHEDVQRAIALADDGDRNGPCELEAGPDTAALATALERRGHQVKIEDRPSGLTGIEATGSGLEGAADPRRDGAARGD
ncbi:MAG TPA: gamma-glutamyltransferase [Stellaceae bacterium]|nr:gamma-glutamyltransferase [Stellaceae bacterium]